MSSNNPYAPPALAEPEAPSQVTWQVDGMGLLARNHVVLPQVDLETGEHGGTMKCIHRQWTSVGPAMVIRVLVMLAIYFLMNRFLALSPVYLIGMILILSFGMERLPMLRSKPGGRIVIWEFVGEKTLNGRTKRRKWRIGSGFAVAAVMLLTPLLLSSSSPDYTTWILRLYATGLTTLMGLGIWGTFDQRKTKTTAGPEGWLRISPVHPDALSFLATVAAAERTTALLTPEPRKRLVITAYFHRYPLRLLIGRKRNPLFILLVALMKFTRSHQLQREIYHSSERENVALETLSPKLASALSEWLAAHPGWTFLAAEQLAFPTGDVTLETALLASADLAHAALVTHSWAVNRPTAGEIHFTFSTWLAGGKLIRTVDQPFIPVRNPRIREIRSKGTPAQVLALHLKQLAGETVEPSSDAQDLLGRVEREKIETERFLVRHGYQSEPREVG